MRHFTRLQTFSSSFLSIILKMKKTEKEAFRSPLRFFLDPRNIVQNDLLAHVSCTSSALVHQSLARGSYSDGRDDR